MNLFWVYLFKAIQRLRGSITAALDRPRTYWILKGNNVVFSTFKTSGVPLIQVSLGGQLTLGAHFSMNNRASSNPIGRTQKCSFAVGKNGTLTIGNNVGMSASSIVCQERVKIGNDVKIGGNVVIYDTDFHSLTAADRGERTADLANTQNSPVSIGNGVFIGAHSTILKGVSIGDNAIIGACSVVTKNIPENEIWGGNPAKFIRKL
jgi:acetyltransferase-like isoleucine patch superfamily enzyme